MFPCVRPVRLGRVRWIFAGGAAGESSGRNRTFIMLIPFWIAVTFDSTMLRGVITVR